MPPFCGKRERQLARACRRKRRVARTGRRRKVGAILIERNRDFRPAHTHLQTLVDLRAARRPLNKPRSASAASLLHFGAWRPPDQASADARRLWPR